VSWRVDRTEEWLEAAQRDLWAAMGCLRAAVVVADRAAFHVQQASEKLAKAALIAYGLTPERTHDIGEVVAAVPEDFPLRVRLAALDRFSAYAVVFRYPGEQRPNVPSVPEVEMWIKEIEVLKADFEAWLGARRGSTP